MSNTDSDTLITISSSSDSGGDVSKDLTQAESYTPHKEIEDLLPELPNDWKPPVQPIAQFCFNKLCLFTVGKPDLEEFWQEVRQEDNWYNRVMRVHDLKSRDIPHFYASIAYAFTMNMLLAVTETADLTSKANYTALFYLSKPLLLIAPLRQMYFGLLQYNEKKLQQIMTRQPGKMVVLTYLTLFRMMDLSFPLACASLAILLFLALPGANPVNYWMSIVGACTLAPFLDAVFKRNVRAMILRGVLAVVMWFGIALGYFQRNCNDD